MAEDAIRARRIELLDDEGNVSVVLEGEAGGRAFFYYEDAHAEHPTEPTATPTGLAAVVGDFSGIRRFANRDHKNIIHWSTFDRGGHFAAHNVPNPLVGDIREFFRRFRWHSAKKPSHEERRSNQLGEHYGLRFLSC